jgi:hypothetical protein
VVAFVEQVFWQSADNIFSSFSPVHQLRVLPHAGVASHLVEHLILLHAPPTT